jgi:hypothetical protein
MSVSQRMVDIVIAKYKENVEWAKKIKYNVIIYDKSDSPIENSIPLPNVGREAHTYLYYIVANYNTLADFTIFLQGNPCDHAHKMNPGFTNEKCAEYINSLSFPLEFQGFLQDPHDYDKVSTYKQIILKRKIFKEEQLNKPLCFVAGAQYIVPKATILNRPLDFYIKLLSMSETNIPHLDEDNKICPWNLERLWPTIFNKDIEIHESFLEDMPGAPFNQDSVVSDTVVKLIKDLEIDCIIETGTFKGTTTAFLSKTFPNIDIYTIEVDSKNIVEANENLKSHTNISLMYGSSEVVLERLLPNLKEKRILFYLDAHWEEYWPLLDEFEAIRKTHKDNCCIVIDDFKVPYRQFQYDMYHEQPLDLDYIQEKMNEVYTTPFYFFNDRTTRFIRAIGKIYILPEAWREKVTVPLTEENGFYYVK